MISCPTLADKVLPCTGLADRPGCSLSLSQLVFQSPEALQIWHTAHACWQSEEKCLSEES